MIQGINASIVFKAMTSKTCRLCLRKEGEFFYLFTVSETENMNLIDELKETLNIQLHQDSRLPNVICSNCYKIQAFFKEFRSSCLAVNNYLIEQLAASKYSYNEISNTMVPSTENSVREAKEELFLIDDSEDVESPHESQSDTIDKMDLIERLLDSTNNFPESTQKDRETCIQANQINRKELDSTKNKSPVEPLNCFSSSFFNGYQLKHEEVILDDSTCDDESQSGESDQLDDMFIQEQIKESLSFVEPQPKITSIMDEYVISNPNKIHNCDVEFNKETLNMLITLQNSGVKLSPSVIKETALKVAAAHGLTRFTASNGWIMYFCKLYNINPKSGDFKINPESIQPNVISNRYIFRYCCNELNDATYEACRDIMSSGVELTGNIIKDIASKIATREGLVEFSATVGWLNSFKKKYQICLRSKKSLFKHKSP